MSPWILASLAVAGLVVLAAATSRPPGAAPTTPEERADVEEALRRALASGRKIDAIKAHRRLHGGGLAEAKEAVERMLSGRA